MTYLEFLYFPVPDLIFLDILTLARSSPTPKFWREERRVLVVG